MKVAIIIPDRPAEIGGGYTFDLELFQSLLKLVDETKHEFVILSKWEAIADTGLPDTSSSRLTFVPYSSIFKLERAKYALKMRSSMARSLWRKNRRLERFLRREKVEFVWFFGGSTITTEIPYMTVVWDLQHRLQPYFPEVSEKGIWEARESIYSRHLQRAAIIITGNGTGKKEIERFYQIPPERIRLLPHMTPSFALEPPAEHLNVLEKYKIPERFLFYPAQFWPHKNHVNLLLALKMLSEKYDLDFPLVFVGSDRNNLIHVKETISELGMQSRVHILGFVPQDDLIALYRQAFALTYVSLFGPENLPPLEAFALGCPVIAVNVPGAKEQLGDAALIAERDDPESIALQIKRLADEPGLATGLREKGRARAERWTSDDFIKSVFQILNEFEYYRRCWGH